MCYYVNSALLFLYHLHLWPVYVYFHPCLLDSLQYSVVSNPRAYSVLHICITVTFVLFSFFLFKN